MAKRTRTQHGAGATELDASLLRRDDHLPVALESESPAVHAEAELDPADARGSIVSIFSGTARKGPWEPPARLSIIALFGGAELDFTEAEMLEGTTEVEIFALFGGVTIRVPEDIDVESQGLGIFGGFSHFEQRGSDPHPPKLRVKGFAMFGGVEIKGPQKSRRRRTRR